MFLVAALLVCNVLSVFAATYENGDDIVVVHQNSWAYHGGKQPGDPATGSPGTAANHHLNRLYWYEGYSIDILTMKGSGYTPQYGGKVYMFCLNYGKAYSAGSQKIEIAQNGEIADSKFWDALGYAKQHLLRLVSMYGFPALTPEDLGVETVDDAYAATQAVIWEIVAGYDADDHKQSEFYKHYILYAYTGNGHDKGDKTPAYTAYQNIWRRIAEHDLAPSFAYETITLNWNGSKYTATVTDENGVIGNCFQDSGFSGVSTKVSGDKITFSTTKELTTTRTLHYTKNLSEQASKAAPLAVLDSDPDSQQMMCGTFDDPKDFRVQLRTATGQLQLYKSSDDGVLEGFRIRVQGNGIDETHTTDENGEILLTLPAGTYTLTEVNVPSRYEQPESKQVTVEDGKTTVSGFINHFRYFSLLPEKQDVLTGLTAQGDATLEGAVYGLYRDGVLLQEFTSGTYISHLPAQHTYTVKELVAPEGYQLDPTVYPVDTGTEQLQLMKPVYYDRVISGNIRITKTTDHPITEKVTPEEGAVFQVYLASAGSYGAAKASERDTVTIGADGTATTKALPYGTYVVHQVSGWEGRHLAADRTAQITQHGTTVDIAVHNAAFKAPVKIVKTDAETGRTIPHAGAGFAIYRPDSSRVTLAGVDTFYTGADGTVLLPGTLIYGTGYTLVEVRAPQGYVLDSTPISFNVTEDGVTVTVTRANTAQKGKISLVKTGEVFTSAGERNGVYQPEYGKKQLAGAVYEVVAAQDIVTPEGTVRVAAGTVVATLTTQADGAVTTGNLYLGKYHLVEKKAPAGCILNPTPVPVELTYAGETVAVTTKGVELDNDRQKVSITFRKAMESDDRYELGEVWQDVQFGLYAGEELTAADGSKIPEGGLLAVSGIDAAGSGAFVADLPHGTYYLQEIATNGHYVLKDTKYPVDFTQKNDTEAVVHIAVDGIENELQRGSLTVVKTFEGRETPVEGVEFQITSSALGFREVYQTDAAGRIELTDLLPGEYVVKENSGWWTLGYLLAKPYTVTITADGRVVLPITNKLQKGAITLTKGGEVFAGVTQQDGKYVPVFETRQRPGAVYELVAAENICTPDGTVRHVDGTVVATVTTEEDQPVKIEDLYLGKYHLVEKKAPAGSVIDPTPTVVELLYAGETVEIVKQDIALQNDRQKVSITFRKAMEDDDRYELGEVWQDVQFGLYAGEELTAADGSKIPEGGLLAVSGIDADGNGAFVADLPHGTYYLQEIATNGHYVLKDTKYPVDFTQKNDTEAVVHIAVDGIENELQRGSLTLTKTSEDGYVAGIPFTVTGANGFSQEMITGEDGTWTLAALLPGEYTITEHTPERYKAQESKTVVVSADSVAEVTFANILRRGNLTVVKTFEGRETPVEGVPFRISCDTTGYDEVHRTDNAGHIELTDLLPGEYRITEQADDSNEGYYLANPVTVMVAADEVAEVAIHNEAVPAPAPPTGEQIPMWPVVALVGSGMMLVLCRKKSAKA